MAEGKIYLVYRAHYEVSFPSELAEEVGFWGVVIETLEVQLENLVWQNLEVEEVDYVVTVSMVKTTEEDALALPSQTEL
jgi:phosphate uptake regulator